MGRLLIVDDESSIAWGLNRLARGMGHETAVAASAEAALAEVEKQSFDAVVLDVRLPGRDGLSILPELRERLGDAPVIVITAYGDLNTAVEALRLGAFDYLLKPFDTTVAERAIERAFASRVATTASAIEPRPVDALVGNSPMMQQVYKQLALAAASDACVHLFGESGTGKELAARAIHRYSHRAQGPFVAVSVASLNESLVESELFGHARGAFTGATEARRGLLEQAHGGTIFLDEVAEVPLALQVKLLRALEYGEVLPVGASRPVQVDFRIVSATHQPLLERIAAGRFREDLFFRLHTFEIRLPPLRDRREDLAELVEHFLDLLARKAGVPRPIISRAALDDLQRRAWHGNVRELRNVVEYAMIQSRGREIQADHLPPPAADLPGRAVSETALHAALRDWALEQWSRQSPPSEVYQRLLELVEPPVLQVALEQHDGQLVSAARSLGLHRITLRKKLGQAKRT